MGQIEVEIIVSNALNHEKQLAGEIAQQDIRTARMQEVLVDTGALMLCLPADVIARLGIPLEREVYVETATGIASTRLFRQVRLQVADRQGNFECLETPIGTRPLLGAIPMEMLGIEPELSTQTIRFLPEGPGRSFMRVYGAR